MKQFTVKPGAQVLHNGKRYGEGKIIEAEELNDGVLPYVEEIDATTQRYSDTTGASLTVDVLIKKTKEELVAMAKGANIEVSPNATKEVIAQAIIAGKAAE